MEIVACHCLKCAAELGRFRNSWNGIGNTYFSPVHSPLGVDGFECTGDVYEAAQGSQIQDSLLQDLACSTCQHILGLRCDSAPDGHLLQQDQLILRLAEMTLVSESSGAKAKISIMKTYPLTNSSIRARSQSISRRASSISRATPRPKPPRLLPGVSGTPSNVSRQGTPTKTIPQVNVTKFKSWTEVTIQSQQNDIDRISGSVERIEHDMRLFKDFMEEIRTELASNRHIQAERENESVATVRGELDILRQKLNSDSRPVSRGSFEMSNRSLDIIAKDLQQVSRKVEEIDEIKRELERLRARLNFVENTETAMMETDVPSSGRDIRSPRKRKNSQINVTESSLQSSQVERSTKRRPSGNMLDNVENLHAMESTSASPAQRINPNTRMVAEIVSKEAAHSTELSQNTRAQCDDVQDEIEESAHSTIPSHANEVHFNDFQDDVDNDYPPPDPTTPVSATTRVREVDREFVPIDKTSLPLSERILHLNNLGPDDRMRGLDAQVSRRRDSNGFLLTKNGKVDRRSLRYLGDQENQTPSRSSIAPETPRFRLGGVQLSDRFETPVLPSIERSKFTLEYSPFPQLRSSSLSRSITSKDRKPFKCGACKKQYTCRAGLKYHIEHTKTVACRNGASNVAPDYFFCEMCNSRFADLQRLDQHRCQVELEMTNSLEDRESGLAYRGETVGAHEATLAERERLVRQTLDREMSLVL